MHISDIKEIMNYLVHRGELSQLPVDFDPESWAFNMESARLQKEAGVDPRKCLQVAKAPFLFDRTPLKYLLRSLRNCIWLSPSHGEYLGHDIRLHWQGVRDTHPNVAATIIWAAGVGERLLQSAESHTRAVNIAIGIDNLLVSNPEKERFDILMAQCGYPAFEGIDFSVQEEHVKKLREAESHLN